MEREEANKIIQDFMEGDGELHVCGLQDGTSFPEDLTDNDAFIIAGQIQTLLSKKHTYKSYYQSKEPTHD